MSSPRHESNRSATPYRAQRRSTGCGETKADIRLQTIVRLRWLAVLGQSLTVIVVYWIHRRSTCRSAGCLAIISAVGLAQRCAAHPATRPASASKSHYAFLMLGYDVLQLGALLYPHRRSGEPLRLPTHRAGHGLCLDPCRPRVTVALGGLAILRGARSSPSSICRCPGFIIPSSSCHYPHVLGIWTAVVLRHPLHRLLFLAHGGGGPPHGRGLGTRPSSCSPVSKSCRRLTGLPPPPPPTASARRLPPSPWFQRHCCAMHTPGDPHYDDLMLLRAQAERCRQILAEARRRRPTEPRPRRVARITHHVT